MIKWLCVFLMSAGLALATELPQKVSVLRGLDKITGRTKTFTVPVGSRVQFGKIFIEVKSCFSRPPEESPEDSAFLYIYEQTDDTKELFQGWMFSSNPALSTMEDPVYDVWLLACQEDEQMAPAAEKQTKEPQEKSAPTTEEPPSSEEVTD